MTKILKKCEKNVQVTGFESRKWATHIVANYSEESLSPNVARKFGRRRKTDEVEDGVIVGMGKFLFKESYDKLTAVINDENTENV